MPQQNCPSRVELSDYSLGKLPEDSSEQISLHIEACDTCQHVLNTLSEGSDSLVADLRRPPLELPYQHEVECGRVTALVEAIGRELTHGGTSASSPPTELGTLRDYQLMAKLGEGGMGAVYKALHIRLKKVVALKVLPVGRTQDEHALERFEREMEAVGRVEHPNIVRAMDASEHEGTHFLVMEYVDGLDLSAVVRAVGPLAIAEACEVIRQAAIGLQHAYEHGLVHRDIKPGNLMLSTQGQVKILDLGLARLGGALTPDRRELTNTGQVMGTLDYMAPEQGGDSREVDIRADIYSLGASLYRLLAGVPPFYGPKYDSPIQKLTALAIEPIPPIRPRRPEISESLAAVIHRMLAKNPVDRFQTPGEVAAALAPFVGGADLVQLARQAAEARRASLPLPLGEVRGEGGADLQLPATVSTNKHLSAHHTDTTRNRAVVTPTTSAGKSRWRRIPAPLVATAAGMAFVLLAATIWLVIRDKDGKEKGRIALKPGDKVEVAEDADKPSDKDRSSIGDDNKTPVSGNAPIKAAPLPALAGGEPLSPIALVPRPAKLAGVRSWTLETLGHRGQIGALSFQPQGELLATVSEDRTIRIWDVKTGKLVHALVGAPRTGWHFVGGNATSEHNGSHVDGNRFLIPCLAWSPDGRRLVYCSMLGDLAVWDVASGRKIHSETGEIGWMSAAWSPDGKRLALGGADAGIRVKDSTTWREVFAVRERLAVHLYALAWSPDSKRLIVPNEHDNRLSLIYVAEPTERQEIKLPDTRVLGLCWAPAQDIGVATTKGVFVVAPDAGEPRHIAEGIYPDLQWSRDGQQLLAGGLFEAALINPQPGRAKQTINVADKAPVRWPTWSSDGQFVASTTSAYGIEPVEVKIYRRDQHQLIALQQIRGNDGSGGAAWSNDGRQLFTGVWGNSRYFSCWDLALNRPAWPRALTFGPNFVVPTLDGSIVLASTYLLDARIGSRIGEIPVSERVYDARWSPDEKLLALATKDSLLLYDREGKTCLRQFDKCVKVGDGACVRWSLDGQRVGVSANGCDHVAVVLSDGEGDPLQIPGKGWNLVWFDARRLAIGRETGWVDVWDVKTNEKVLAVKGSSIHGAGPVQWLEKEQQLVTVGYDRKLRFWDREGELVREMPLPDRGDVFSPDLRFLASDGCANSVRLWDLASGQPQGTIVMLRDGYHAIVSPDGHIKASPEIKNEFIYVVEKDDSAQIVMTRKEFEEKYGWKNDPTKVRLLDAATSAGDPETSRPDLDPWIEQVAKLPAEAQVQAVAKKLQELNPGFDGKVTHAIKGGQVTELSFFTPEVTDLSPVRALVNLKILRCPGRPPETQHHGKLVDLSPLKGMKLRELDIKFTQVADLSPLRGMPLTHVNCEGTKVSELTSLHGMPLEGLSFGGTAVSDLSPLRGMRLQQLNFTATPVADLTPLRGMPISALYMNGTRIADLSPLENMPLGALHFGSTQVTDLSPLRGMPLGQLHFSSTPISDLTPLKGIELGSVNFLSTKVTDISPLKGMSIRAVVYDVKPERDAETLKSVRNLETINSKPVAEFWKEVASQSPRPKSITRGPEWKPEPVSYQPGDALALGALVTRPAQLKGVASWTIDTRQFRGARWGSIIWPSPDRSRLAVPFPDGSVRILDIATGVQTHWLPGPGIGLSDLSWSGDGSLLACRHNREKPGESSDEFVVWDAITGQLVRRIVPVAETPSNYRPLQLCPSGEYLAASVGNSGVWVWKVADGTLVRRFQEHKGSVQALAWTPDGTRVLSVGTHDAPGDLHQWSPFDQSPAQKVSVENNLRLESLSFSHDGRMLAGADSDGRLIVFDSKSWEVKCRCGAESGRVARGVFGIAWSPDDMRVLVSTRMAREIDAASGELLSERGSEAHVGVWHDKDRPARYIAENNRIVLHELDVDKKTVVAQGWTPGSGPATIHTGDAESELLSAPAGDFSTYRFSWSADRRWFVEATDGIVQVWDAPAGKIVRTIKAAKPLVRAAADPAGKLVAAADDEGKLFAWSVDGQPAGEFPTTLGPKSALIFSPDGQTLLAGGKGLEIFDVQTRVKADSYDDELATPGRSLAFLDEGKLLAIRGRDKLRVIDMAQQKPVREIELAGENGAFFADDRYCFARDQTGVTRIAELATGRVESVLHLSGGHWLAVSPEGHYRGSAGIEEHLAFTAVLESGEQQLLSPTEFAAAHGWKNDPTQVRASGAAPPADTASWGKPPEPVSYDLPVIKPTLKMGTPLTERALVARPARVPGLASWTVETREPRVQTETILEHPGGKGFLTLDGVGMLRLWKTLNGEVQSLAAPGNAVYRRGHISPDGRYTACVGWDGRVCVVDNRSRARVWEFVAHQKSNFEIGCAWSPDGLILATGGSDRKICLWDVKTRGLVDVIEPPDMVAQLHWSPDGAFLAAGRSDTHDVVSNQNSYVSVWDSQQRSCFAAFTVNMRPLSIDWTPDGQNLITSFDELSLDLAVWSRASGTMTSRKLPATYSFHALSPDGTELAFHKYGGDSIQRFSFPALQPIGKLTATERVRYRGLRKLAWLPRANQIVSTTLDGTIFLWKPTTEPPRVERKGAGQKAILTADGFSLRWSSDMLRPVGIGGRYLSFDRHPHFGHYAWSPDGAWQAWSYIDTLYVASADLKQEFRVRTGNPNRFALSPDGRQAASLDRDAKKGAIWDVRKPAELCALEGYSGQEMCDFQWSPAGDRIAIAIQGGPIENRCVVSDSRTGKKLFHVNFPDESHHIRFSPNGARLVGLNDRKLMIADSATGNLLYAYEAPSVHSAPVSWLPDGGAVAYLGSDRKVHVVDPETGNNVRVIGQGIGEGVFNRNGSLFVSFDLGGSLRVFNTTSGELEYTLLYVRDDHWLALSPDGHYAGSQGVEELLVYVAMLDDGSQVTLSPAEFAKKYDWKNDPSQLKLRE